MTKKLTPEEKEKVHVLFVSVDVERDSLDVLKNRLSHYSSNFYGGVDTEENLNTLMGKFGATYSVYRGKTPDETAIDHTTEIFVINDKNGWYLRVNQFFDKVIFI
jgi:protein SCO1/2